MRHKTLEDVHRVVALGKPEQVIDAFIADYLTGAALAPVYAAEDEYADLLSQEDLEPTPAVVDETSEEITPAIDHNQIRDDRIIELVGQYPHLVSRLERPIPSVDVQAFKQGAITTYLRRAAYPDIGDQLDAIWKQLNYDRMRGRKLIQATDDHLCVILTVKARYKKG